MGLCTSKPVFDPETDQIIDKERDRLWKSSSFRTYESVWFMYPCLRKGDYPSLNFNMSAFTAAEHHFKANGYEDHHPPWTVMEPMHKQLVKQLKVKHPHLETAPKYQEKVESP